MMNILRISAVQHLGIFFHRMVIVTHEMAFARTVSDRVVFMDKGVVLEDAAPAELFGNPKHQRTREFLSRYLEDK